MECVAERLLEADFINYPRFSPNGECLTVSSINLKEGKRVCQTFLLNPDARLETIAVIEHSRHDWLGAINYHPIEKVFAASGYGLDYGRNRNFSLQVWDYSQGALAYECFIPDGSEGSSTFTPDGTHYVIARANEVRILRWPSGQIVNRFWTGLEVYGVDVHPNGSTLIITHNSEGHTGVSFVEVDEQIVPPSTQKPSLNDPDYGEYSLIWSDYWQEWDDRTLFVPVDRTSGAIFSPDGQFITLSHWNPVIYTYPERRLFCAFDQTGARLNTPHEEYRLDPRRCWSSPIFTPDSRTLICGSEQGMIFRWDVQSGELLDKTQAHDGLVVDIALSPDGKMLASCGRDKKLKLWQ